ncbi:hypothetical protein FE394_02735 [Xenorhabdus sp. Reich]|uniref:N-acetyltransferase n=1 Tax=Xenorhabdus littoralis TaxID=2582835 RepID=A0ABU4SHL3_9GAMM|nr:hypothetical protein [Xenorhabdus sp. Reich]MDX7998139.1 hypothetical protein [Xenorhabdus sp. Reich]
MIFNRKLSNISEQKTSGSLNRWNSSPELTSHFIDRSSLNIIEVSFQEALNSIHKMKFKIEEDNWEYMPNPDEQLDEEQRKWKNRCYCTKDMLGAGINILNDIKNELNYGGKYNYNFFVSYFKLAPIGALILSSSSNLSDFPEVMILVTHSGIKGSGILLIEEAVNKSQQLGKNGKLKLFSLGEVRGIYSNMGFVEVNSGDMELDPAVSHRWHFANGRYRFK